MDGTQAIDYKQIYFANNDVDKNRFIADNQI